MGQDTKIEWATHTLNPWRGCQKVSEGCRNCYAETLSRRNPAVLGVWGPNGTRVVAAESTWREPLKWDRDAKAAGVRHRVFCASLADIFEDRPELHEPRQRLLSLIERCNGLDWLLLTKRPENVVPLLRHAARNAHAEWTAGAVTAERWLTVAPPANVWLGTSVEDQAAADARIPHLLATPAAVRFLSCEPLLGPVDLERVKLLDSDHPELGKPDVTMRSLTGWYGGADRPERTRLSWVIVGGESGPGARPCNWSWIKSIADQCRAAAVPVFVKQLGAVSVADVNFPAPKWERSFSVPVVAENGRVMLKLSDHKGGDPAEWPADLRVRQFPAA